MAEVESFKDGRLEFNPQISESSPVIKGTLVTVDHIVSCIIEGWTWSDILRHHPEITEDDIRACLSHAIEHAEDSLNERMEIGY